MNGEFPGSSRRLVRMRAVWSAFDSNPREIASGYARMNREQRALRRRVVTLGRVLPAFLVFGAAVAFAASRSPVVDRFFAPNGVRSPDVPRRPAVPALPPKTSHDTEETAVPFRVEEVVAPVPLPGEAAKARSLRAPSASRAPSAWEIAASAMRARDYDRAERAFDELSLSPEARTRDAARLARAQLWIARGANERARPELESLARRAATLHLRERAEQALRAIE